jgi:hypothetical protein
MHRANMRVGGGEVLTHVKRGSKRGIKACTESSSNSHTHTHRGIKACTESSSNSRKETYWCVIQRATNCNKETYWYVRKRATNSSTGV